MSAPSARKRKARAPIGVLITYALCEGCVETMTIEGAYIREMPPSHVEIEDLVEGDDAGRPYLCRKCSKELAP